MQTRSGPIGGYLWNTRWRSPHRRSTLRIERDRCDLPVRLRTGDLPHPKAALSSPANPTVPDCEQRSAQPRRPRLRDHRAFLSAAPARCSRASPRRRLRRRRRSGFAVWRPKRGRSPCGPGEFESRGRFRCLRLQSRRRRSRKSRSCHPSTSRPTKPHWDCRSHAAAGHSLHPRVGQGFPGHPSGLSFHPQRRSRHRVRQS